MVIGIKILDTEAEIKNAIMNIFVEHVNKACVKAKNNILKEIRGAVISGLKETTEYDDLTSGILKAEFGFLLGEEKERIDGIIDQIARSIEIEFIPFTYKLGRISGSFKVYMLIKTYEDILGLKEAVVDADEYGSFDIPWLDWFINYGGQVVISDYHIVFGEFEDISRSGFAIMGQGGMYVVPGDNSPNDNWLTRFFSSPVFQAEVEQLIALLIKGNL